MRFLVFIPWKPVVLIWGLLTAMILIGFTASSLLQGTDYAVAPGAAVQSTHAKADAAHTGQQQKQYQRAARSSNQ